MKNNPLPESPFFQFMNLVGDIALLNLCWLAGCLPVITAGASTTAAFAVANKLAAGQEYRVFHDYGAAFKRDFGLATRTWLPLLAAAVLLWGSGQILLADPGPFTAVLLGMSWALWALWLAETGAAAALLGRFAYRGALGLLKDGLAVIAANPRAMLFWLVPMGLLPVLRDAIPTLYWYLLPLWVLLGGGTAIVLTARALRPAFLKIERK